MCGSDWPGNYAHPGDHYLGSQCLVQDHACLAPSQTSSAAGPPHSSVLINTYHYC